MITNRLLIDALHCRNQNRPPVWLMRQAGRYMPEYRAIRAKYSFLQMCHTPELIVEVTKLPLKAFNMDAAILFSDILVIPEAYKIGLRFDEGIGPIIENPVTSLKEVEALPDVDVNEALKNIMVGIGALKEEITVPLLGFCGAPFTVASYMIEGKSSRDLRQTKKWMIQEPKSFHRLLQKICQDSICYLEAQIQAGVDGIQLFDSWAHVLNESHFKEFSLRYMQEIVNYFKTHYPQIPVILFCKGSSVFAPLMATLQPHAISVDWNIDLARLRSHISSSIALQGNFDPDLLYGSKDYVKQEALCLLDRMQHDPGFIFNLGHGIHPDTPYENVRALVETVQHYRTPAYV